MVSRTTKTDGKAPMGAGQQQSTAVAISPQIIALVLQELGAGAELAAVAGKYGIPAEVITTWRQAGNGGAAPPGKDAPASGDADAPRPGRMTGRYTTAFKQQVLAQVATGRGVTEVAAQYGISVKNVYHWKAKAKANGGTVPEAESTAPPLHLSPIDEEHRRLVLELKAKHPVMGLAQVQHQMRRFHAVKISRAMVARIFAEAGIPLRKQPGAGEAKDAGDNRFEMSRPNELWAVDFKEFWIQAEKVYGLFLIDDFSRFCVGFALTKTPTADLAIATVSAAVQRHGRPERVLSDRGPQFHAWNGVSRFDEYLAALITDHTVTKAEHAWTNGKIEAFNKIVDEELLHVEELASFKEAETRIARFVLEYNFLRTHTALAGLVPADRYFGMVKEAQQALLTGLAKAGPGLAWLRGVVSQDTAALRPPTLLQLVVRDGKIELVVLGQRFTLGA
jgi:transposase InsO family protein/transposase-like protein